MMDIQAAKARCEGVTVPVQWTEEERREWMRGCPYSPKFTQGVVHQLSAALEALEEAQGVRDEALGLLRKVLPALSGDWDRRDDEVDAFLDRILGESE